MKSRLLSGVLFVLPIIFCSCSDKVSKEDQENRVTVKVSSNTPGAPIVITDYYGGGSLTIKDHWEGSFTTKSYKVSFHARCEDKTVLISCEIYVNGRLKKKWDANGSIDLTVDLK